MADCSCRGHSGGSRASIQIFRRASCGHQSFGNQSGGSRCLGECGEVLGGAALSLVAKLTSCLMVYDTASSEHCASPCILAFVGGRQALNIIRTQGDDNEHEGKRIFVTIVNIQKSPPPLILWGCILFYLNHHSRDIL